MQVGCEPVLFHGHGLTVTPTKVAIYQTVRRLRDVTEVLVCPPARRLTHLGGVFFWVGLVVGISSTAPFLFLGLALGRPDDAIRFGPLCLAFVGVVCWAFSLAAILVLDLYPRVSRLVIRTRGGTFFVDFDASEDADRAARAMQEATATRA